VKERNPTVFLFISGFDKFFSLSTVSGGEIPTVSEDL